MSSTSAAIQVEQFVASFSKAWKKLTAYPSGHPEVVGALDLLDRHLGELRGPAGEVVLGVSANSLVYGTMEVNSFAAQKLAQALYNRGVAIVRLGTETSRGELEVFLRLLGGGAVDPRRSLWEELTAAGVVNINLQPVDYGTVHVRDGVKEKEEGPREVSLWDEVLRALLDDQQFSAFRSNMPRHVDSAEELARWIAEYAATPDEAAAPKEREATFGVRLQGAKEEAFHRFFFQTVGNALVTATGLKRQNSFEQAIQLLRTLPDALRRPLIRAIAEALSSDSGAAALLRDFASELPKDEVLDALRYLSSADKLSAHSSALLRSLTTVEPSRAEIVSRAVLADVIRVFGEDDVTRFNNAEHGDTLERISTEIRALPVEASTAIERADDRADPATHPEILRHFAEVLLEALLAPEAKARPGPVLARLEQTFPPLLAAKDFAFLEAIVRPLIGLNASTVSEPTLGAVHSSLDRISAFIVESATNAPDEQLAAMQRLIDALDAHARQSFLESLAVESNRSKRRRLMNFIAAQGRSIVPQVIAYLGDQRWYVVRNMIILLRSVKDETSLPVIRKLTRHPDLRVRLEAIKTVFTTDRNVPGDLLYDLFIDPDPKFGQTAVALAGTSRVRAAVDPLLRMLQEKDYLGAKKALRIRAIRSLGEIGDERALTALQKFFTASLLPWPPKDERYAAWESLAGYPAPARQKLITDGLRSADARVRELCARIGRT